MTNHPKCTDEHHLFQVRFICEHAACENSLLCCACFQTHKEETGCPGVYGVHIREFEEDVVDTPLVPTTKRKTEEVLQGHNTKKATTQEKIQKIFDLEIKIRSENGEKLDEIEERIVKHLKKRKEIWKDQQEAVLRKMSESIKEGIFTELEGLKEKLGNMNFESQPFSKNSSAFRELNFKIIPEAEKFIRFAEQAMDLWRLNQNRLDDYAGTIEKVIDGIEYEGLLHEEKLQYKIEDFPEVSEGLLKLNGEVEGLRKEKEVLMSLLNKAQNEKKSVDEELGKKADEMEGFSKKIEGLLEKEKVEKAESEKKIGDLEKMIEVEKEKLTKLNEEFTKKGAELEKEKNTVENLNKDKTGLIEERDKLNQEKTALQESVDKLKAEITALKAPPAAAT